MTIYNRNGSRVLLATKYSDPIPQSDIIYNGTDPLITYNGPEETIFVRIRHSTAYVSRSDSFQSMDAKIYLGPNPEFKEYTSLL
jgi:hypothetical protein